MTWVLMIDAELDHFDTACEGDEAILQIEGAASFEPPFASPEDQRGSAGLLFLSCGRSGGLGAIRVGGRAS